MRWVSFIPPKARRIALKAAQADHEPVLITGETGSGKSGIARWIHANSPRSTKPFLELTPGADWTSTILTSQGGTLYVPELESLSAAERGVLLTLLKYHSFRPTTETGTLRQLVHARVIVGALAKIDEFSPFEEHFLEFQLHMPPLSDRAEEFEDIVMTMLREIAHELGKDHLRAIDRLAWANLKSHSWPGNLRELRNVLRVAALQAQGDRLESTDLPRLGSDDERIDFLASREQFEKATIRELLKTFQGGLEPTSRTLRVDVDALKGKLKAYGIDPNEFSSSTS